MLNTAFVHRASFRGYTLIELLIALAILGLSSILLIPHLVGRDIMKGESAVRQLIGDLSFAQSDALARQEIRRVHFYDDGSGYCLTRINQSQIANAFDPDNADYIIDPLNRPGALGRYIVNYVTDRRWEGVSLSAVEIDGAGRDLHYDELGGTVRAGGASGLPGTGGTIQLSCGAENYEITVAPFTGKLTVRKL
jgi:prepilin-type N-terminal cleavage/methylation domain-containing protein